MEAELDSPLVAKLRQQTKDNAEANARRVELEMFQNAQSGQFGPFSRFVPVMKADGSFVLVLAGEYEELKKQKRVAKQKFLRDEYAAPFEARAEKGREYNAAAARAGGEDD